MMRSLYSGVAGLKNHQVRMDVLGNNIANVNTNGFKKGRTTFQDMISQTLQGPARPTDQKGGVNPKQVGLGMTVAAIDNIHTQGSLQTTGKVTDLAIQGEGFFILKKGDKIVFTRAGNYNVDSEFNLVNQANGWKVQGYNIERLPDGSSSIGKELMDVKIPIGEKEPARATENVKFRSNLNSRVTAVDNPDNPTSQEILRGSAHKSSIVVYDNQGNEYNMEITFTKRDLNVWQASVNVTSENPEFTPENIRFDVGQNGNATSNTIDLIFNEKGSLISIAETGTNPQDIVSAGELVANVSFDLNGTTNAQDVNQSINLNLGTSGLFDGVTQFSAATTTKARFQDGYKQGYLESFDIDQNGIVTGVYSNGVRKELSQVALATFINPMGLTKAGDNNYLETNNSGRANIGAPDTENRGIVLAGMLEMSNVDLSEEFTDMIVTQRGFQANSRTITTSDQMLQELLTLKR